MLDVDQLIADLRDARAEDQPRLATKEVLERALHDAAGFGEALRPARAGIEFLHHSPEHTVLHVVWAPGMQLWPHDHRMWAAIGIYAGQEDNAFYRRNGATLTESGGQELRVGDVALLGDDTIHGVTNPLRTLTAAIHVYGGDFINQPRSQWGPGPLEERPYDIATARQQFAEANAAWSGEED